MFAGIYHWYPKMFGRFMNETLGKIHFWGTIIGGLCGILADALSWDGGRSTPLLPLRQLCRLLQFDAMNQFITIAAIVTFGFQLLFVINFFYSIWKGKKMTTRNPGGYDLEWTTPIDRPFNGNWPGKLPTVQRWAYDYGKDGQEFIPQIQPLGQR